MADKKISELDAAGALAGTEDVPIVQGGETVRTTTQDIADLAAATPGGSTTEIQYNNAGAFDGDPDMTWLAGEGMVLGGATEAAGVVTPGANDIALAVGNYAVPGWATYAPGSATEATYSVPTPLIVDHYLEGDLTDISFEGLNVLTGIKHTGAGGGAYSYGIVVGNVVASDSTENIYVLQALYFSPVNWGSGAVDSIAGASGYATHNGSGTVAYMDALAGQNTIDAAAGLVTDAITCGVYTPAMASGGATNVLGVRIQDHSGLGASRSLNILSEGAASLNVFEGNVKIDKYIEQTEMTAPAAPAANGVRIYAVDNGAGKTQLMAIFSSGAAQQLAIQP
jgi:hypothetical protein